MHAILLQWDNNYWRCRLLLQWCRLVRRNLQLPGFGYWLNRNWLPLRAIQSLLSPPYPGTMKVSLKHTAFTLLLIGSVFLALWCI